MRSLGLLCLLSITTAQAQQFVPDAEFGDQGVNFHQGPADITSAWPVEVLSLPNGKYLMASATSNNGSMICQHLANGDRDSSFAVNGVWSTASTPDQVMTLRSTAVQQDGRIVALFVRSTPGSNARSIHIARSLPNGQPDPSFQGNGVAVVPAPDLSDMRSVIIQPDGRIIFAGTTAGGILVGRLEPDGQLDLSFGTGGLVSHSTSSGPVGLSKARRGPFGDVFLAGYLFNGLDATGLMICKLLPSGALDTNFGTGGFFIHDHSENVFLHESLVDLWPAMDGSLYAAGQMSLDGIKERFCALKLSPNGTFDPGFADGGLLITGTAPTDRNFCMDLIYDPRGFFVLHGVIAVEGIQNRSLFLFVNGNGQVLADDSGEIFQIISSPDVPRFPRRLVADQQGGFVQAMGYFQRPIGRTSLTRFILSWSLGSTTTTPAYSGELRTWPNPTKGTLQIDLDEPFHEEPIITVLDPLGRMVADETSVQWSFSGERSITLELPNSIADGRYFLVMTTDTERRMAHIVVQR